MSIVLPFALVVALIFLLVYLAYRRPMEAEFLLDSDGPEIKLVLTWLSFFRMEAELAPDGAHARVYLFDIRISSRRIIAKRKTSLKLFSALSLSDTSLRLGYALNDPFLNGLMLIGISMAGDMAGTVELEQFPDFIPGREYLYLEGTTQLNLGRTMANLIRSKIRI